MVSVLLLAGILPQAMAQAPLQNLALQSQEADPPGRIGFLGHLAGQVRFSDGDSSAPSQTGWTAAVQNRPLTTGDRLWTARGARSELHIGSTAVRMDGDTRLDLAQLDDDTTSLHLPQGTLNLRVRALFDGQRLEVRTPNLAFVVQQPGEYRLDVIPSSNVTRVVVLSGAGQVYGDNGVPFLLGDRQQSSFTGTRLAQVMLPGATQVDAFDAWATQRNRLEDQSVTARHVPREVTGYQQLDAYGDWSEDPSYGAVWIPRAVPANWAPYSAGHWDWIAPWGWTWVDDAPWGFAPFHYGRWTQIGPRWAWAPGRLSPRPVYAPALVGFIGGASGVSWNIALGNGRPQGPGFGWFPLAPGEAFRPHYRGSPRYVGRLNNNIVVDNRVSNYRYQRMPGAVTAVRVDDFQRGRPVRGNGLVSAEDLRRARLAEGDRDLPGRSDLRDGRDGRTGPRPPAGAMPPPMAGNRPVPEQGPGARPGARNDRADDDRNGRPGAQPDRRPDTPAASPDRSAQEAVERRARFEQEQQLRQQRERMRPQNQPGFGVPGGESQGQRAEREQAQKNGQPVPSPVAPNRPDSRNNPERGGFGQPPSLQRDPFRQQRLDPRPGIPAEESLGQRAMRETAQRDQEARRQQQQQQFKDQAERRAREQAMQGQARQAQEQQRQLRDMQRAATGTTSQQQARPDDAGPRAGRGEGNARRPPPPRPDTPAAP